MDVMTMQGVLLVINVILTISIGIVGYVFKSFISRVETLERNMLNVLSEDRVRQLLDDKLEVIHSKQSELKSDIRDIKTKLDQIINIGLMGQHGRNDS